MERKEEIALPFPSKKWLDDHNLRIVFDKGERYHIEHKPNAPLAPAGKRPPYKPKPIDQDHLQKEWDLGEVLDTVDSHYRIIEEQLGKLVAKLDVIEEMMKNDKNKSASRKA
jgi:hypothetical protein